MVAGHRGIPSASASRTRRRSRARRSATCAARIGDGRDAHPVVRIGGRSVVRVIDDVAALTLGQVIDDHQHVDVAALVRVASGVRAEQEDLAESRTEAMSESGAKPADGGTDHGGNRDGVHEVILPHGRLRRSAHHGVPAASQRATGRRFLPPGPPLRSIVGPASSPWWAASHSSTTRSAMAAKRLAGLALRRRLHHRRPLVAPLAHGRIERHLPEERRLREVRHRLPAALAEELVPHARASR